MNRLGGVVLGAIALMVVVLAGPAALTGSAISAQADGGAAAAVPPVRQLLDGLLQIMKARPGTPSPQRYDMLAPVIDGVFDLDAILRASVGLSWSSLPPDQQDQLRSAFRRYTTASYVNSFDHFDGQRFTVEPQPRPAGNGEQIVVTRITPRSGDSHEIDCVMRNTPSGWRRVAVQRSDFRRLLSRGGAPALANSLASKSLDLSAGMS
jgi:phospholipid transport system substrate-binding protein